MYHAQPYRFPEMRSCCVVRRQFFLFGDARQVSLCEELNCLGMRARFLIVVTLTLLQDPFTHSSSQTCVADLLVSKKRQAPKATNFRPAKRPFVGLAAASSFSSSSTTAQVPADYFLSAHEEHAAVAAFEARNEAAARKLLNVLNSGCRLWATHEWFYSGVSLVGWLVGWLVGRERAASGKKQTTCFSHSLPSSLSLSLLLWGLLASLCSKECTHAATRAY
jgi:hypothetical protein